MSNISGTIRLTTAQALSAGVQTAFYKGDAAYLHIRYAPTATPSDAEMSDEANDFIGLCTNQEETAPTTASSYTWARINYQSAELGRVSAEEARSTAELVRGEAEEARTTAEQSRATAEQTRTEAEQSRATAEQLRADAEVLREAAPKYLHIRYSAVAEPTDDQISATPDAYVAYVGFAVTASATAPTEASAYTWSRSRGLDGDGSGDMLASEYDPIINAKALKPIRYTATIGTEWSGSAAPYTQEITVIGILATDYPDVDIVQTGTESTDSVMRDAWGEVTRIVAGAGTITVYAEEAMSTAIPIQIKVVR